MRRVRPGYWAILLVAVFFAAASLGGCSTQPRTPCSQLYQDKENAMLCEEMRRLERKQDWEWIQRQTMQHGSGGCVPNHSTGGCL